LFVRVRVAHFAEQQVMSVISAIIPNARRASRFDVIVDGKSIATLSLEAIERLQLTIGRDIADSIEHIAREEAEVQVYDRALNMLAFRARASAELSRALVRKGADRILVDRVVGRLKEQGILDDVAFAQAYTRAKVLGASQSRRRVQQGLAKKGVARDVSENAIASVWEDEAVDQHAIVERAARKKLRALAKLEPVVRKRRLYAFLARRGYEGDDIRRVMTELGEEISAEDGRGVEDDRTATE
jgi:regulatory protein